MLLKTVATPTPRTVSCTAGAVLPQDHVIVVRFAITDGGIDSWDEIALGIAAKLRTCTPEDR
jgi:hypothetical protein